MLSHKGTFSDSLGWLMLVGLFLVTAGLVSGQSPMATADKQKIAASPTEPVAPLPSVDILPTGSQPGISRAADAMKSDLGVLNASAEAPKAGLAATPKPVLSPCPANARQIHADVVAVPQPIMLNRLGAAVPDGLVFALANDTSNGYLLPNKRPRPIVLRANVGDCLMITFKNSIPQENFGTTKIAGASIGTTEVSLHIQGMEWVDSGPTPPSSQDDGSFVGRNKSSLASVDPHDPSMPPAKQAYTVFVKEEGTFLLYTMGDSSVNEGRQLMRGLFGALNVEPAGAEWYRSQVTADDLALATYNANSLPGNATLNPGCTTAAPCTLTITGKPPVQVRKTTNGSLQTLDHHPLINYDAKYPSGTYILRMLDPNTKKIEHSDLTAIITGPNAGRFLGISGNPTLPEPPCNAEDSKKLEPQPGQKVNPLFCQNPASPDRRQPYREVTVIYHEMMDAVTAQAFPVFGDPKLKGVIAAGKDAFAINYGTGGIAAEVYANRIGVGPMGDCVDCKFEEFFLSAWSVGDPSMLVDKPANSNNLAQTGTFVEPCGLINDFTTKPECGGTKVPASGTPYKMQPLAKANAAYFPDDPSNVYHSYINDHVKFRILHGGTGVTHVHHQHAHQWLQSPNSDEGSYLDSQMISPGSSYTLEMVYNGSGNRNKVVGDSIFHCHFYPHFAAGMWAMWRTHDVFESGTYVYPQGTTINNNDVSAQVVPGSRALPDGEIIAGVPTPAVVPLPTLPMAPLPAYAQIQTGVTVQGAPTTTGGQVVIGGTCSGNQINGLDVIGNCVDGQKLNGTVISSQYDPLQMKMTGQFQPFIGAKGENPNPGFPYFIPGIAGARAPHPPLDFAPDAANPGQFLDGGLPRHLVSGGTIANEQHTEFDWSKDLATMDAVQLPEAGTAVEILAMNYFGQRCHSTYFPNGTEAKCQSLPGPKETGGFILNGLGPKSGAPFADPAIQDNGLAATGPKRVYKAAAIQMNVVFNKSALGWHFPQQRMLTLWEDVSPTIASVKKPEPLFFRGNSGDLIEYWHTNLVPDYYLVDDFQVRTPTDILGQHIHLVKFDVTSSDGAGNGFNYEDGTFSPEDVQHSINAINNSPSKGFIGQGKKLTAKPPPATICTVVPVPAQCKKDWMGAQTTIQRWYLDPLLDNSNVDRTLRTVFTHDHFGPSTHQQAGLYAGLLVEPTGSTWTSNDGATTFGSRASDGGPTSWQAIITTKDKADSYREFALEFQDFQLAYQVKQLPGQPPAKYSNPATPPDPNPSKGYRDRAYAIGAPGSPTEDSHPTLISTLNAGTQSVNYLNEPIPWRAQVIDPVNFPFGDLSNAFDSNIVGPALTGDPLTPILRAYQGDKVQVRLLVGAHMFAHQFNLEGPTWFSEPSWKNSGYRSVQAMGLSEHYELLFNVPSSSAPSKKAMCPDGMSTAGCADYLYSPSFDEFGLANGLWGLFRAYDPTVKAVDQLTKKLVVEQLPNNPIPTKASNLSYATCPGAPNKFFDITAVSAQAALATRTPLVRPGEDPKKGQIVFNDRGDPKDVLRARLGIMYVYTADLDQGKLKGKSQTVGAPIEPLILRANAGDCIQVTLTNGIADDADIFGQPFGYQPPLNLPPSTPPVAPTFVEPRASKLIGLHPQLLAYDASLSSGVNVGFNRLVSKESQVVKSGETRTYTWYAGKNEQRDPITGNQIYTPVEFGSLNLFASDPLFQNSNGLFGSMVIEPERATWKCDAEDDQGNKIKVPCEPTPAFDPTTAKNYTRASATVTPALLGAKPFREFVVMISDSMRISSTNSSAINYRTEPESFRYQNFSPNDFSCMLSNQLVHGDPRTPIFTASPNDQVRFRMTHPFGTGTSQVFSLHGHVWQRNPYSRDSRSIGRNNLSQWIGSRDNHGSTDHFEVVLDRAGGSLGRSGDYLYTVYLPVQASLGAWGVFRVGKVPASGPQFNNACPTAPGTYVTPPPQKDIEDMMRKPAPENKDKKP